MHRQIAGKLTGPITKWIVLVGAIVLVGIMAPLNGKLIDVQDNDASSWVPESAESTKVSEALTKTIDPNNIPTLVVYSRDGGLTPDDLDKIEEQGREMRALFESARDGGGPPDFEAMRPKMEALRKKSDAKLAAVLTDAQKKQFEEMKGDRPFLHWIGRSLFAKGITANGAIAVLLENGDRPFLLWIGRSLFTQAIALSDSLISEKGRSC